MSVGTFEDFFGQAIHRPQAGAIRSRSRAEFRLELGPPFHEHHDDVEQLGVAQVRVHGGYLGKAAQHVDRTTRARRLQRTVSSGPIPSFLGSGVCE